MKLKPKLVSFGRLRGMICVCFAFASVGPASAQQADVEPAGRLAQFFNFGTRTPEAQPVENVEAGPPDTGDVTEPPAPGVKPKPKPRRATRAASPPPSATDTAASSATGSIKMPQAGDVSSEKTPKPRPTEAKQQARLPKIGPIPPERPSGDLDENANPVASSVEPTPVQPESVATTPALPHTAPSIASAPLQDAPRGEPAMLLIVRPEMVAAQDLEGRRVAVWNTETSGDDVTRMFMESVGVTPKPIKRGLASGLKDLARGDVDAVLLGIGPRMSAPELAGLEMRPFRIMELSLRSSRD